MFVNIIESYRNIVAVADKELIGKTFEEEKLFLDISKRFYEGELFDEEKVIKVLSEANNLSLVGEKIIGLALKEGFINEEDVIRVQGVPHAQIYICE